MVPNEQYTVWYQMISIPYTVYLLINIDSLKLSIINVYAPNHGAERVKFFKELKVMILNIHENLESEVIIGGDFNTCLNEVLDRRYDDNTNHRGEDQGAKEINEIMTEYELEDIWRRRYTKMKRYSYFKKNSKSASRIDYWLTSKTLDPLVTTCYIRQAVKTDHSFIYIEIKTSLEDRGPNYWKFNNKLLENEYFHNTFCAFWDGWKREIDNYELKKNRWEATKYKIKALSIQISKHLNKQRCIKESVLSKKLEELKNDPNPNHKQIHEYETELNEAWSIKTEGAITRARTLYYEKGEKSTKYFFLIGENPW